LTSISFCLFFIYVVCLDLEKKGESTKAKGEKEGSQEADSEEESEKVLKGPAQKKQKTDSNPKGSAIKSNNSNEKSKEKSSPKEKGSKGSGWAVTPVVEAKEKEVKKNSASIQKAPQNSKGSQSERKMRSEMTQFEVGTAKAKPFDPKSSKRKAMESSESEGDMEDRVGIDQDDFFTSPS